MGIDSIEICVVLTEPNKLTHIKNTKNLEAWLPFPVEVSLDSSYMPAMQIRADLLPIRLTKHSDQPFKKMNQLTWQRYPHPFLMIGNWVRISDTVIIQQVFSSQFVCFLLNLDSLAGDLLRHTLGPTTFTGRGIVPRYQIQETREKNQGIKQEQA